MSMNPTKKKPTKKKKVGLGLLSYSSAKLGRKYSHLADGIHLFCEEACLDYQQSKCVGAWGDYTGKGCTCKKNNPPLSKKKSKEECKKPGDYYVAKLPKGDPLKRPFYKHPFAIKLNEEYITIDNTLVMSWASSVKHLIKSLFEEGELKALWKKDVLHLYHRDTHTGLGIKIPRLRFIWKVAKENPEGRAYLRFNMRKYPKSKGKPYPKEKKK